MDWVARFVGLFYLLGGLAVLRKAQMNALLDKALSQITLKPVDRAERIMGVWLYAVGALTALSGGLLLFLSRWAVVAFVACWLGHTTYLFWARRHPDLGVTGPTAAVILYGIATLAVIAWSWTGVLR